MSTSTDLPVDTKPRTRRGWVALIWLVGIAVYAAAVAWIGWKPVAQALGNANASIIVIMSAVNLGALWIRVFKWRVVLGAGEHAVPLFWVSKAAGEWSPGRVGELSPLLLGRFRTPKLAAWIVIDRVLEIATTLGLGAAGILLIKTPNRTSVLASILILAAMMTVVLLVLMQRRLFAALALRCQGYPRVCRFLRFLEGAAAEGATLLPRMPAAIAITLIAGISDVWAGILLIKAFGYAVSFALVAAVKGLHAVTSAVPITPNATGVPYFAAAVLLHEVGGVPSNILAAAIALSVAITNVIFWLSAASAASSIRGGALANTQP